VFLFRFFPGSWASRFVRFLPEVPFGQTAMSADSSVPPTSPHFSPPHPLLFCAITSFSSVLSLTSNPATSVLLLPWTLREKRGRPSSLYQLPEMKADLPFLFHSSLMSFDSVFLSLIIYRGRIILFYLPPPFRDRFNFFWSLSAPFSGSRRFF